jgi:hypothetical protein
VVSNGKDLVSNMESLSCYGIVCFNGGSFSEGLAIGAIVGGIICSMIFWYFSKEGNQDDE